MATSIIASTDDAARAERCRQIACIGRYSEPQLQRFVFTFADGTEESQDHNGMMRVSWWRALPTQDVAWIEATLQRGARILERRA
jgi:hypothetical protein